MEVRVGIRKPVSAREIRIDYIRSCEPQHISDLNRKHIGSKRKRDGILRGVLKRWPEGHQAAIAILASVIGNSTRLHVRT